MKISIITITYNNLDGFKKTRDSVLSQTYKDFEWIVVDGGSSDGTGEFLQSHSNEYAFFCSEKDTGVYNAQNKGISKASGDYLICMNAGDIFHSPSVLETVFSNPHTADIIYGDWIRAYRDHEDLIKAPKRITPLFFYWSNICHQAMFVKTSLLKSEPFDESYKILADWAKWRSFVEKGYSFEYCPLVVCDFEAGCGLSEKQSDSCIQEIQRLKEEIPADLKNDLEQLQKPLTDEIAERLKHIDLLNKKVAEFIDIISEMSPVYSNIYAKRTYSIVNKSKVRRKILSFVLKIMNI